MVHYISEKIKILSISLFVCIFPNFVLANSPALEQLIENKIQQMTLEEKVGQLFMIGFPQKELTSDLEKFISTYKPGSFLLFKRNIASINQLRELNLSIYKSSYKYMRLPPLIAIDQEGGSVSRLPIIPAPPNALAIGQTESPMLAEEMGYQTGLFLREVGINMNLAPVLDVSDPFGASFIGARSFGGDPTLVGSLGVAYSQGLLRARVIPTAKHFPGAGDIKADPHLGLVTNQATRDALFSKDLKPYEAYIKLGSNTALMVSHFTYPSLDMSGEPASFSKKISKELLRDQLGFGGLVITDDLQMQGSKQLLRPEVAALKSLQSGADIVMVTWSFSSQEKAFEYVKKGILNGDLTQSELTAKLRRILMAKSFVNLYKRQPLQPSLQNGITLSSQKFYDLELNILEKNLNANIKQRPRTSLKIKPQRKISSEEIVCILAPTRGFIDSFKTNVNLTLKSKIISKDFKREKIENWIKVKKCKVTVFAITGAKTAKLVQLLNSRLKKRTVVVNLSNPKYLVSKQGYLSVLNLFFNHSEAGRKVAEHLNEIVEEDKGS